CDPNQIQLNDQLVKFIATDLLPLSIVDSDSLRELLQVAQPQFNMPSRNYLSTIEIPHQHATIESKVKSQIQKVPNICLSLDVWSSTNEHFFIGIIANYIVDFTQHSVLLGCQRLKDRPNDDLVLQMYNETITAYDIADKVCNIITDNISRDFSIIPDDTVAIDADEDGTKHAVAVSITDKYRYLPLHHSPCFTHALQLVVSDSLQESDMQQVLTKGLMLLGSTEGLESSPQDGTSWNNQLKMLRPIKTIPEETLAEFEETFKLVEYEIKLIIELCEILKPFEEVMDRIDGEQDVTSSLVIACVRSLRQAVARQKEVYKSEIVDILESSIEKHISQYEQMDDFKIAATVDPRFKLDWCKDDEVEGVKNLLMRKAELIWSRPTAQDQPVENKRSGMFSFMTSRSLPSNQPWDSSSIEVSEYLNQPCEPEDVSPLDYWQTNHQRYPVVAQIALQYLSIPASSQSTKRIYSNDGKVFRPETCNLSDARFEQLMFIRCNYKIKD
ncbi:uncharacterized protein, partial [Antedon mediterranea]|uniref:uncharacterized protein n=1 Tax=Antedon mediterranea TaxID=105859 RepID=UPI003AF4B808